MAYNLGMYLAQTLHKGIRNPTRSYEISHHIRYFIHLLQSQRLRAGNGPRKHLRTSYALRRKRARGVRGARLRIARALRRVLDVAIWPPTDQAAGPRPKRFVAPGGGDKLRSDEPKLEPTPLACVVKSSAVSGPNIGLTPRQLEEAGARLESLG